MITLKSSEEIKIMREAGRITAKCHEGVKKYIKPGVSTLELDEIVKDIVLTNDATFAFLNYNGFPKHICTSVNEQVVHGIPSSKVKLNEGDIVSIDIGVFYKGYCGDAAKTHPVGKISEVAQNLIDVTKQSFYEGIRYATNKNRLYDISHGVQEYVEKNGFSVVRDYVGHGVGVKMHEEPSIPNYGKPNKGVRLQEGMTLAIEPMVNEGTYQVESLDDGWTVITLDGKLSAHYEHSVAITDGEPLILTAL